MSGEDLLARPGVSFQDRGLNDRPARQITVS